MSNSDDAYDVLIAYNSADEEGVTDIVKLLKQEGINPWFDKDLPSGVSWIDLLEEALRIVTCVTFFFGKKGEGRWEENEIKRAFEYKKQERDIPLIPVLLPDVSEIPREVRFFFATITRHRLSDLEGSHKLIERIKQAIHEQRCKHMFEIEIDVSKAAQSCFLAMPKEKLDDVYKVIKQVIEEINRMPSQPGRSSLATTIKLIQTRNDADKETFTNDAVHAIRESELVIAVCTPQDATGSPYPEVLYELGMAHALGKPSILVTTKKQIPAYVEYTAPTVKVVEYAPPNDIQSGGLAEELKEAVEKIVAKIQPPFLVAPNVDEIRAIRSDLAHIRATLWPQFLKVLSFGLMTHDEFRDLMNQSHVLLTHINELAETVESERGRQQHSAAFTAQCKAFRKGYEILSARHTKWKGRYFEGLEESSADIEKTFNFLRTHLHEDLYKIVDDSMTWYSAMLDDIKYYLTRFEQVQGYANEGFNCLEFFGPTMDLKHVIEELNKALGLVHREGHNMMCELSRIIMEDKTYEIPSS